MIQNIPFELQRLNQWVCAGDNKLPINPHTGAAADVTNPSTWGTFLEARSCSMRHIGFVLSKDDPYTIIDLDDPRKNSKGEWETDVELVKARTQRHCKILELFESYAEYSQSGYGIHIIVKGKIPKGCRRDRVEVYSDSRYMICTGKPYNTLPISEQQGLLDRLFAEMNVASREEVELVQIDGALTDDQIYNMASTAANANKFNALWQGQWQNNPLYPSQSEADFALISMLCFYTKDNEQVRRLFRFSALGQREKATRNDKHLNYALKKIRAEEIPTADISELLAKAQACRVSRIEQQNTDKAQDTQGNDSFSATPTLPLDTDDKIEADKTKVFLASEPVVLGLTQTEHSEAFSYPPGFVGDLAEYFYSSAVMPVKEIALVAALGLCAGVVGRSYNISNTGLNQYIVLIAKTGVGKEGISNAIESTIAQVRSQIPGADQFIGPASFGSGQGLLRTLQKQNCFISVLGEFGITLESICDPKANTATQMLKKVILDLYNKSGFHSMLRPTVYSDTDKNLNSVQAPNVTIVGETTPSTFYDKLDLSHLQSGLIPRFIIVEYTGLSPEFNKRAGLPASKQLIDKFAELAAVALTTTQNRTFCPVQMDSDADKLSDSFRAYCRKEQNEGQEVEQQLWSRAHLKALRLAGLIAVGCNMHEPIVNKEIALWAFEFIRNETSTTVAKFKNYEFGNGEARQESDLKRALQTWFEMSLPHRRRWESNETVHTIDAVPQSYLYNRVKALVSFKEDKRGAITALKVLLGILNETEALTKVAGCRTQCFVKGPNWERFCKNKR